MTQNQDALDAMMGFDPSNTNPFTQETSGPRVDPDIYKTNPKDSVSDDGVYRSKIRLLYNPYQYQKSIVTKTEWYCQSQNGNFSVNGLVDTKENRRNCPLFKASSQVFLALNGFAERFVQARYPGAGNMTKRDELLTEFNSVQGRGKDAWAKKFKETTLGQEILAYAKDTFDNTTSSWVIVQILEDDNKPDLVGQFKIMKLPKVVLSKIEAKMYPSEDERKKGKKPIDLMSWVLGYPLEMNVKPGPDDPNAPERKQREISYDLCDFSTDFEPIRKIDGTSLFSDEELETLEEFASARKDAESAKSQKKKDEAAAKVAKGTDLYNKVLEMTKKALDYLRDEAKVINIVDKIEYKPWDDVTTKRVNDWIDEVTFANVTPEAVPATVSQPTIQQDTVQDVEQKDESLPF